MAGGGVIIIRNAMQKALTDPMVSGSLPPDVLALLDPFVFKTTSSWTHAEHRTAAHAFNWAAEHC